MALVRWDPFAELNTLHQQLNTMFTDTFSGMPIRPQAGTPVTDVTSDDNGLTVEAQLPNFKEDEITVQLQDGDLEIKAEHAEKEEGNERNYLMRESVSRYYRRITLPQNSDTDSIKAAYEDGVLRISVPYKELPQPKRIQLNAKNTAKK